MQCCAGGSVIFTVQVIQPVRDKSQGKPYVSNLTMVLRLLRSGEDSPRDGSGLLEGTRLLVELVKRYVMVFSARQQKHILPDALGNRTGVEPLRFLKIGEWAVDSHHMHSLPDAPVRKKVLLHHALRQSVDYCCRLHAGQ